MNTITRLLATLITVALFIIAGCGHKGPLEFPEKEVIQEDVNQPTK